MMYPLSRIPVISKVERKRGKVFVLSFFRMLERHGRPSTREGGYFAMG